MCVATGRAQVLSPGSLLSNYHVWFITHVPSTHDTTHAYMTQPRTHHGRNLLRRRGIRCCTELIAISRTGDLDGNNNNNNNYFIIIPIRPCVFTDMYEIGRIQVYAQVLASDFDTLKISLK